MSSSNPVPKYIPQRTGSRDSDTHTPMFIAALFTTAQRETTQILQVQKQMWYVNLVEYYSALKRNDVLIDATV